MNDGRIVVSGLTKQYRSLTAVNDLSFTVESGRVTGFLGPNGAGKTTTLRMLLNLVMPNAGTATIGGRQYVDLDEPDRVVGAVLEASSAHRGRTGRNHLRACCITTGLPRQRAEEVLDLVGLQPQFQRGRQRVRHGVPRRRRGGPAASARAGPRFIDPGVLHDREHPSIQPRPRPPLPPPRQTTLERGLHQVVRVRALRRQGAGEAAQAREQRDQLALEIIQGQTSRSPRMKRRNAFVSSHRRIFSEACPRKPGTDHEAATVAIDRKSVV